MIEAATVRDGGCIPVWWRLQPCVMEAAALCDGGCNRPVSGGPSEGGAAAAVRPLHHTVEQRREAVIALGVAHEAADARACHIHATYSHITHHTYTYTYIHSTHGWVAACVTRGTLQPAPYSYGCSLRHAAGNMRCDARAPGRATPGQIRLVSPKPSEVRAARKVSKTCHGHVTVM